VRCPARPRRNAHPARMRRQAPSHSGASVRVSAGRGGMGTAGGPGRRDPRDRAAGDAGADRIPGPFPYTVSPLYLFFGPTSTIRSLDLSMAAVDTRLPRYWHQCRSRPPAARKRRSRWKLEKADSDRIRQGLLECERPAVAAWPEPRAVAPRPRHENAAARLYAVYESIQPRDDGQRAFPPPRSLPRHGWVYRVRDGHGAHERRPTLSLVGRDSPVPRTGPRVRPRLR
jgi:hypothetical protein